MLVEQSLTHNESRRILSIESILRTMVSESRKVDLVSFYFSFLFLFYFQFIFLFLALRVRVKPMNTRRDTWKNNVVQWVQHMSALRCTHSSLG